MATGRVKASPLAKRLASELGLDIRTVQGSGPAGRVIRRDIEAAAAAASAPPVTPAVPATVTVPAAAPGEDFVDIPLSQMRKTVARRLAESLGPVPHFFLTVDVDMTRALAARVRVNELLAAQGARASLNDMVIKAVAVALTHHPDCNAWWQGDSIRRFSRVHIGVAVAVPDGLITPVVTDAHAKGLGRISTEVRELAGRAREKKLQPHEYTGSTFSISNLGMFGIEEFTAVINPPEAGIIAVGAVEERPVVVDGEVVVQPRMRITMSCDHRVIDGAQGARFLATLKSFLEEPAAILI
ncbi:MAG: 2-oxo acid dehydrogenase subunit E2 [Gemmatimonadetes bacterium]|nr:2-oxo acid dehydrogenase subunit E2 [Gemmatimonadota bacterium]